MSNYATKADLKNATGVDTLNFAKKTDYHLKPGVDKLDTDKLKNVPSSLGSLKSKEDKLGDIWNLETTPTDLSKLSNVVKNDVLKKTDMKNWLKKLMLFRLLILVIQLKKTDYDKKLMKLKRKLLIIIMTNILLLKNLIK